MFEFFIEAEESVAGSSTKDNPAYDINYSPKLDFRTPYRNLYLAVISNAFNQLFEPLFVEVRATTNEVEKLTCKKTPKAIKLKWDFKVANCMNYQVANHWFMADEGDHVFNFIACCDIIGFDSNKIRDRVKFIDKSRKGIVRNISMDTGDLKNIVRGSHNIFKSLRDKHVSRPKRTEYSIIESTRRIITEAICEEYVKKFGVNPIRREEFHPE
jgi:hypothetical protein